ncbi:MAG: hypothetical protein MHM6MM_000856 [Cercozoa sp. M6MM]
MSRPRRFSSDSDGYDSDSGSNSGSYDDSYDSYDDSYDSYDDSYDTESTMSSLPRRAVKKTKKAKTAERGKKPTRKSKGKSRDKTKARNKSRSKSHDRAVSFASTPREVRERRGAKQRSKSRKKGSKHAKSAKGKTAKRDAKAAKEKAATRKTVQAASVAIKRSPRIRVKSRGVMPTQHGDHVVSVSEPDRQEQPTVLPVIELRGVDIASTVHSPSRYRNKDGSYRGMDILQRMPATPSSNSQMLNDFNERIDERVLKHLPTLPTATEYPDVAQQRNVPDFLVSDEQDFVQRNPVSVHSPVASIDGEKELEDQEDQEDRENFVKYALSLDGGGTRPREDLFEGQKAQTPEEIAFVKEREELRRDLRDHVKHAHRSARRIWPVFALIGFFVACSTLSLLCFSIVLLVSPKDGALFENRPLLRSLSQVEPLALVIVILWSIVLLVALAGVLWQLHNERTARQFQLLFVFLILVFVGFGAQVAMLSILGLEMFDNRIGAPATDLGSDLESQVFEGFVKHEDVFKQVQNDWNCCGFDGKLRVSSSPSCSASSPVDCTVPFWKSFRDERQWFISLGILDSVLEFCLLAGTIRYLLKYGDIWLVESSGVLKERHTTITSELNEADAKPLLKSNERRRLQQQSMFKSEDF